MTEPRNNEWIQTKLCAYTAELRKLDKRLAQLGEAVASRETDLAKELYAGMATVREDLLDDAIATFEVLSGLDEIAARRRCEERTELLARLRAFDDDYDRLVLPRLRRKRKDGVPFVVQKNQPGTAEKKGPPSC